MFTITIAKPCHEDWQKMTPTSKGAFCKACAKEVIDFTAMSDHAVKNYLLNRTHENLCGHFNQQQIERIKIYLPVNIFRSRLASWKKFLAILMLAFSTSLIGCDVILNQSMKGEVFVKDQKNTVLTGDTTYTTETLLLPNKTLPNSDTTKCDNVIMGKMMLVPDSAAGTIPINGQLRVDTVIKPTANTVIIKKKNPADTSNCGNEIFY